MKLKTNFKVLLVFGIIFVAFLLFNTNQVQASTMSKGNIYKADTHEELNKKMGINGEWYEFMEPGGSKYEDNINKYYTCLDHPIYFLDIRFSDEKGLDLTDYINLEAMGGIEGRYEENADIQNKDIYLTFLVKYNNGEDYVDLGNSVTINGLGTFTKKTNLETGFNREGEMTRYQPVGYQMKITDTSIFNNKYLGFDMEIQTDDMTKIVTGFYQVNIAKKEEKPNTITSVDKENNVNLGITGNISDGAKITTKEIVKDSDTYLSMQSYISNKTDFADNYKDYKFIFMRDIKIENGTFDGKLTMTFDIGEKYNGQKCVVLHKKNNGEYEYFKETVENGKATIEVTELSPFAILIAETKQENNTPTEPAGTTEPTEPIETTKPAKPAETAKPTEPTETTKPAITNKEEKDETPKTGTIDIIGYALVVTLLAGAGIVSLKKNIK